MATTGKWHQMHDDEQLQSIVYFLSDHVCCALEAGEAIQALSYEPDEVLSDLTSDEILVRLDDFHQFLNLIRHYEYLVLTRLNQARHWATQLRQMDSGFRPIIDLFTTATSMVDDANGLLGEDDQAVFNGAGEPQHFMESRCLVVRERSQDGRPKKVSADEHFLLGGKVLLEALLEVCNTFHLSLDSRFSFDEEPAQNTHEDMTDSESVAGSGTE